MENERMAILEMIQAGTVTTKEGAALLKAVDGSKRVFIPEGADVKVIKGKMLKVIVDADDAKVNLQLPLGIAKAALKIVKPQLEKVLDDQDMDLDFDAIIDLIDSQLEGEIVSIDSADATIKIIIE